MWSSQAKGKTDGQCQSPRRPSKPPECGTGELFILFLFHLNGIFLSRVVEFTKMLILNQRPCSGRQDTPQECLASKMNLHKSDLY